MTSSGGRLTRKNLNASLKRKVDERIHNKPERHVTHYQVFTALHDLIFELDSAVTVAEIQSYVKEMDDTVRDVADEDLKTEIFQTLMEGVVNNWCRCVKTGYFKPTSEPPSKVEADRIKRRARRQKLKEEDAKHAEVDFEPPRNLVIHGEVSNEDEVPGFMITVDEFVEFMKQVQEKVGNLPPPSPNVL